jgi:hypothetical protein
MLILMHRNSIRYLVCLTLIVGVLLSSLPQPALAQELPGPVLWLKFDEAAGATTFADSSTSGANGSCTGAACPTAGATGRLGQAIQLDGANDRVTVTRNAPAGAYTLAAWVRNDASWNGWSTIFQFGEDAPWFGVSSDGQLTLYPVIFGGSVPLGKWVHVAYSWDGTANRLYMDGQMVQTNQTAPPGGGNGLGIGLAENGRDAWLGFLDDLRVYERTLSDQEVEQLAKPEAIPVIVQPPPTPTAPNDNARLIDLTVSLYKTAASETDRQPYVELFQLFADALYEATNGAHKLRTITIYDNGRFSDRADIRWIANEVQPRASTNGYGKGRGTVHMGDTIFNSSSIANPDHRGAFLNTLIHEWGHYMYGVLDEYEGRKTSTDPGAPQVGDTPPNPCSIMCAAGQEINFANLNFSTPKSTAGAGRTNTAHYRVFQASGWEVVARSPNDDPQAERGQRLHWPDLAAKKPAADQDSSVELPANQTAARAALNIVWADANATTTKQRIFLVNISADMGENNKLESAKLALKNYVDSASQGDQIAIITFADVHTVVQPFTTIDSPAARTAIKNQIDTIQTKPGVNDRKIDAADQAALAILAEAANNAVIIDRGVFVIIDGGYTDQTEPHIFQKIGDQHGQIPLHVFNFAATNKPNDLYGNSLQLMRPFVGSYTTVSAGGFTIPTAASSRAESVESSELIDAFADVDQEASPIVDVDLGTSYNLAVEPGAPFSTTIFVDATLDELEVVVFYDGAEGEVEPHLSDPGGQESDPPLCDADGAGTLCFFSVSAPDAGGWLLEIDSLETERSVDYEATGYALNGFTYQAILSSLAGAFVSYPQEIVLVAELSNVERIAKAGVTAWVEKPDGNFADLTFKDDGVAPDDTADDGLYTAILAYDQPGDYYVTAVFDNIAGEAVFTQAGMADVDDFETTLVPDDFDRFASLEVFVDGFANDDHNNTDAEATDIPADNGDIPGRIDSAGDVDRFRLTSPQPLTGDPKASGVAVASIDADSQRYILRLSRFALGMNAIVRVTTSAGSTEHQTGALGYDGYWTLPLDLTPGEVVLVEVRHSNSQASGGFYAVSFGNPVAGEVSVTLESSIYLPVVVR